MSKKIIVITTGGTIGSILQSDSSTVDQTGQRLFKKIKELENQLGYTIEVISPLNKNSESFYPSDWVKILEGLKQANESDADGIVVAHGTDTMEYSVAAASSYDHCWNKKICFTGSFYTLEHPSSDVTLNFAAALRFSVSDYPANGTYLVFKYDQSNNIGVMHGGNVKPMGFDDQFFSAFYNDLVSIFNSNTEIFKTISLSKSNNPCLDTHLFPTEQSIFNAQNDIAYITLYPGIDRKFLDAVSKDRKILVFKMYHSGTGPTDIQNCDLVDFIKYNSTSKAILMGAFPERYLDLPYKSTNKLQHSGAHIYANLQPHLLYTFSLLSLGVGMSPEHIIDKLSNWEMKSFSKRKSP